MLDLGESGRFAWGRAQLREYGLAPDAHHLNHGGFGAVPTEVVAAQERWRAAMEANPTRFFRWELPEHIRAAAAELAAFVGVAPERLAFVENASSGVAAVARSMELKAGDEILATDHVYNSARLMFREVCGRAGASFIEAPVGMPVTSPERIVAALEAAITPRTRLILIDHIASATALIQPVEQVVALARRHGVPVLVDGAHGPGQLTLNLEALGADIYVGNCHKWLMAPRGSAFVAVTRELPFTLRPTVISHSYGQGFPLEFDKIGTRDATPWLATPDAIRWHERLGGAAYRQRNVALALTSGRRIAEAVGTEMGGPPEMLGAMAIVRLPGAATMDRANAINHLLWREHRIEVPVMVHSSALWLRVSIAAYVDEGDIDALLSALPSALAATA